MTTLPEQIINVLKTNLNDGARAKDIAKLLNIDKSLVNNYLYGELNNICYQDSNYNWYLNSEKDRPTISINNSVGIPPDDNTEHPMDKKTDNITLCPSCNSPMVVKLARSGRNAGNRFFGCSTYPNCTCTLPYNKSIVNNDVSATSSDSESELKNTLNIPREFKARPKFENYQSKFFDVIAVRDEYLNNISYDEHFENSLKKISKWRLDYPINNTNLSDKNILNCLAVLEKILLRGHITRLSQRLEIQIIDNMKYIGNNNILNSSYLPQNKIWLDGYGIEDRFYNHTLPALLGPNFSEYVIPQVEMTSLLKTKLPLTDKQRVDFLICIADKKIIVELDGVEHKSHEDKDNKRDKLLQREDYIVYRIPNEQITLEQGDEIEKFKEDIQDYVELIKVDKRNDFNTTDSLIKLVHQIQVCILEAIFSGTVEIKNKIHICFNTLQFNIKKDVFLHIINEALEDFCELGNHLADLYNIHSNRFDISFMDDISNKENSFCISFDENEIFPLPTFYIQDIKWEQPIIFSSRAYKPTNLDNIREKNLVFFLNYIFRKTSFREGQFESISRALTGNDAIVLLPTGHGKSIAFQLASLLLPGISVVIDPIISLIDDQIDNLRFAGIDRCIGITSQISNKDDINHLIELFAKGEYQFCYIAPERFQTIRFREALRTLTVSIPICLIAVDEAHCVSEWGHDFRTAYLNIGRISREYCRSKGFVPPLLALTGTASRIVLKDVIRVLQIDDFEAIITPTTFDRAELNFEIITSTSKEKGRILRGLMDNLLPSKFNVSSQTFYQEMGNRTHSGLVFCPHVNGEYGVFNLSREIQNQLNSSVDFYSGTKPKYFNDEHYNNKKRETARRFKNNKVQVLVATKAFGMGIDKPNVRFTIHYGIPGSIEAFYQEAGRAGRDGQTSHCIIIYSNDDKEHNSLLLDPNSTYDTVRYLLEQKEYIRDDINRSLFFHTNSFKGVEEELKVVQTVISRLTELTVPMEYNFIVDNTNRNDIEKGLHRLITLGIVADYTIDYSSNEFTAYTTGIGYDAVKNSYIDYVSGYHRGRVKEETKKVEALTELSFRDFIIQVTKHLITFIYDVLEKSRRRALNEMSLLCSDSQSNEQIRDRIMKYLQTEYSESIEKLLDEEESGLEQLKDIVESVRSLRDATSIRGEVSRYLESYPDHPGLLLLRGIIELFTDEKNKTIAEQNIMAGISTGVNSYDIPIESLYETIGWMLSVLTERDMEFVVRLLKNLLQQVNDDNLLRTLITFLPSELNDYIGLKLLNSLSNNLLKKIN